MKYFVLFLFLLALQECRPDSVPQESCNNARVKYVTVVRDVRFGMSLDDVLNVARPDTFFLSSFYPDTSVTFVSDFYGTPARYYAFFDRHGLSEFQIRTIYGIDPQVGEVWRDSISLIYGSPEKVNFQGSANAFYWRWILCDGGRATLSSNFVINTR